MAQVKTQNVEFEEQSSYKEQVIKVFRCSTVVKGGRRFSFAALVAVGDERGRIGLGYGKANEVPPAVEKAIKDARKNLQNVKLKGSTIPHPSLGKYGATSIQLIPAAEGTGIIAGSSARAILELSGVRNVLSKIYGSTNAKNVAKATLNALMNLYTKEQIEAMRA